MAASAGRSRSWPFCVRSGRRSIPAIATNRVRVAVSPLVPSRHQLIPVSVLTGFLGSGKTTILGHLLRQPEFSRTAVIINEFGEIGLDHELVEASEDSFIELQTGCLCCKSPHRPGANPARPAAAARRGQLSAVRSHRDRDQRACRPGADPANADDRHRHRRPSGARRHGDDRRCREWRRHAGARRGFAKAGRGRRPARADQTRILPELRSPCCSAALRSSMPPRRCCVPIMAGSIRHASSMAGSTIPNTRSLDVKSWLAEEAHGHVARPA